jgi:type II secretory pathway pseudopilin PulG
MPTSLAGSRRARTQRAITLRRREGGITLMETMVVVFLIALLAAISFPAVTSGIDSLRMRQATDTISSVLNQCLQRAERQQTPVELTFDRTDNALYVGGMGPAPVKRIPLPQGIVIAAILPPAPLGDDLRRQILLMPGAVVPRIGVLLVNGKGQRRIVSVDPITGIPVVTTPGAGALP